MRIKNTIKIFAATVVCVFTARVGFCQTQVIHPAVTITPQVSILIDKSEDAPVHRAAQDLVRDFKKVLGKEPKIISSLSEADKDSSLIVIGCDPNITGFESHLVTTRQIDNRNAVVLQGADMRGTIYAIYAFSEKFLEIPPLWIWASYEPQAKKEVKIPEGTYIYFPSPYVKWRAWFPNDRDLVVPWQSENEENFDSVYETMLRLKLNTFELALEVADEPVLKGEETESKAYKAGRDVTHARDRGLKVSFTHTSPFGANFGTWNKYWKQIRNQEPPKLSVKNVEALKDFWRYHIETIQREKIDVIWQLGFRSSGDKAFWETFADSPETDAERAKVIESMLKTQIDLLRQTTGRQHHLMKITFYNEVSDFLAAGLLKLPDEPNLIWNFVAARRDHYPAPDIQNASIPDNQLVGYYMNFQFTSSGSHLAAAEGPWKMEKNFRFVDAKCKQPLAFSVVNAGNLREHVCELSANAAMMWNFDDYKTDDYMKKFCKTYFGEEFADDIAALYKDFYFSY